VDCTRSTPNCTRRLALHAALAAALAAGSAAAPAASYPTRELRIVAAAPAGAGGDVVARIVAAALAKVLKQPVLVENKPGADGNIATDIVARAQPDGYTLLFNYTGHVINPGLYASLPFDPVKDFTPISMLATNWTVLVVRGDHPAKSVADLVAMMRKQPGALSTGFLQGSATHMAAELFLGDLKLDALRIPYKSNNQAMTDLLGGRMDFTFSTLAPILGQLQAGKVRALAVTENKRSELLPGVPAMAETVPGYSATGWYGLVGPKGLPTEVVDTLNAAVRQALGDAEVRDKLTKLGSLPAPSSAQEFGAFIATEIPRWRAVIKKSGITPQ
jgi:tripartite-type tricarboxylate transporter receptor subunit TctC